METKAELKARAERESLDAHMARLALKASLTGTLDRLATVHYDGWTVKAYAHGLDRMDGGVLVLYTAGKGQRPYATAYAADRWLSDRAATRSGSLTADTMAMNKIEEALRLAIYKATHAAALPSES